ncbi:hypothetical protein M427DRAFT_36598 [Gonapodya prolifera JEL478]|uniref:Bulb-type lectin domain-containing protein n=1 Tax=Gonapodya prolifera (strain JEL478) TaxID=1344416 RepID=A0A139A211_GONPJ|nr:hypothetical protein M427DRAFT_36598 [Gonapodya prolifera JEL478]|eukprot:KXS10781.1 hypothetical protein M427DRAFT_36598 [Gonapodya prolifera JEL478]
MSDAAGLPPPPSASFYSLRSDSLRKRTPSILKTGMRLEYLVPQSVGVLVMYANGEAKWSSATHAKGRNSSLELTRDGRLVLVDERRRTLWQATHPWTDGNCVFELRFEDDDPCTFSKLHLTHNGTLFVTDDDGRELWRVDLKHIEPDGDFELVMQDDGNLVLYKEHVGGVPKCLPGVALKHPIPVWSSKGGVEKDSVAATLGNKFSAIKLF